MSLALPSLVLPAPPGLAEQFFALRRRWRVILACTFLVPILAFFVLLHLPRAYSASGVLLYAPQDAAIPGQAMAPAPDARDEDALTASQAAIIASLPAAAAIARQLHLADRPEFNPARRARPWPLDLLHRAEQPDAATVTELTRRALCVAVLPGSRVLTVSFTSTDPELAAAAANLAMRLYLDHERDQSFAALTDAQAWLESHAATMQAELDATEARLAAARAAAGVVQGAQASLTTETASRLAASLVQAEADLAMDQARLAAAGGADSAAANAAVAPNLLPLRKEQADLSARVHALSRTYGSNYPDLQAARTELAAITAEIDAETGRELAAARAEVAADQAQISTLQSALGAARDRSESEDADSGPIRALEQRADAGRDMLRAMTLQADQLAQQASLTRPDARIVSLAPIPATPSGPNQGLILAAAAALGLCFGLLLAGLLDGLDTSFRSGAEIRQHLNLACLALVPEILGPRRAVLEAPFSLFSEQLRALRTAFVLAPQSGKIIAVTAARPGEGKTTLTISLARALALSGLSVLAIDGDIRQPSFDQAFFTEGAAGLTDHLAGLATLDDILHEDPLTRLRVIPAGTQARSALSLFLSPALPACLEALRERFDVILLDAPPAFALAEGRVLARVADSTLFCIRWAATPRRVVQAALQLLREAGVNILGATLTRVDIRAHGSSGFADAELYTPRYGGYFRG